MSRATKIFIAFLVILFCAWWLWRDSGHSSERQDAELADMEPMVDRIWIDHIPKDERDKIDVFVMLGEPNMGGFSKSSAYEGDWASFEWNLESGLHFRMLQSNKKHNIKATIIKGTGCAPFDYCLRLRGAPRGSKRYGSMEDWVLTDGTQPDPRALIKQLLKHDEE